MLDILSKYRTHVAVAIMLLLPAGTLFFTRGGSDRGPIDGLLLEIAAPMQAGAHYGLTFVEDFWRDYLALRGLKEENDRLRREVARLREERARLIGVLQENARLRELLAFQKERPELKLQAARVIARDITPFFRVVRIRLDTRDVEGRVEPQMPVISYDGVVGQIVDVQDGTYADVMLLADPRSQIDVVTQRNRTRGIVKGLGHKRDYESRLAYLRRKDEIHEGDEVVTSGKGGIFPQELRVGTITAIRDREFGLHQEATIVPSINAERLEEVFIITGEEAAGVRP